MTQAPEFSVFWGLLGTLPIRTETRLPPSSGRQFACEDTLTWCHEPGWHVGGSRAPLWPDHRDVDARRDRLWPSPTARDRRGAPLALRRLFPTDYLRQRSARAWIHRGGLDGGKSAWRYRSPRRRFAANSASVSAKHAARGSHGPHLPTRAGQIDKYRIDRYSFDCSSNICMSDGGGRAAAGHASRA